MASRDLRVGSLPFRVNQPSASSPTISPSTSRSAAIQGGAHPASSQLAQLRTLVPLRYRDLEPASRLSLVNDNPVFNTSAAAAILGMTSDALKKWRQRKVGPNFLQYGESGPVRYELNELLSFRADHMVRIRRDS